MCSAVEDRAGDDVRREREREKRKMILSEIEELFNLFHFWGKMRAKSHKEEAEEE